MKVFAWVLLLAGLVVATALPGGAVSLCDYVSPTTSLSRMRLSFNYQYAYDAIAEAVTVSAGRARLDYSTLYDAPDFGYSISGRGELSLTELQITAGLARSSGTARFYLTEEQPFFAYGGYAMSVDGLPINPELDIATGVGYGRFTDVTPLAKAMRIGRMLEAREVLPTPLSGDTLMGVAQEIGRRDEYETVKELVEQVVLMIQEEADVEVDPRSVLTVEDLVVETGDERYCGWAVQAGLSYRLLDPHEEGQDILLGASASLALPPTPESQLLLEADLSGAIDILQRHTLNLSASYIHEGDPLDINASLLLTRRQRPEQEPLDTAVASLSLAFPVGRTRMGLELVLTKPAETTRFSVEIGVSATLRLL